MKELFLGSVADRTTLANAITDKGVNTNSSDDFEVMAENIRQIFTGYIFTLTAKSLSEQTSGGWRETAVFNIASVYPNYKNITLNNIIIQIPYFTTTNGSTCTMSYSYNNTNGDITVTGTSSGYPYWMYLVSSISAKIAIVEFE